MPNECRNCGGVGDGCRTCWGSGIGEYYDYDEEEKKEEEKRAEHKTAHAQEKIQHLLDTLKKNGHTYWFSVNDNDYWVSIRDADLKVHQYKSDSLKMTKKYLTNFIKERGYNMDEIQRMLDTLQANGHNCSFDTECYRHAKTVGELEIDYRVTIQEELETHKHHSNSIEMVEGYLTNFINQRGYQHA